MESIFQDFVQLNYTLNKRKLTLESIKDNFQKNSTLSTQFQFSQVQQEANQAVSRLIEQGTASIEAIETVFKGLGVFKNSDLKELVKIWAKEKKRIISFITKQNQNVKSLAKLDWSLNQQKYSRGSTDNPSIQLQFSLKLKDQNNQMEANYANFEMNVESLGNLCNQLTEIENSITSFLVNKA